MLKDLKFFVLDYLRVLHGGKIFGLSFKPQD